VNVNRWRVYINPFDADGNYTGYVEVTQWVDLQSISAIQQTLDNTDYDIGVYRNSNITLKLNNKEGLFTDYTGPTSMFRYKRSGSLVKVTWEIAEDGPYCGQAICGEAYLSEETTMFIGILDDEAAELDVSGSKISFLVLGRESLFARATVPADVDVGDLLSEAIYKCLNQAVITDLLGVDASNIECGTDVTLDDVTNLETLTVREALDKLLLVSNSVLTIQGDDVHVTPRTAGATVAKTFYGQASADGIEDIQDLKKIRTGLARVFNYLVWEGTATVVQDAPSVAKYGIHKRRIDFDFITDSSKRTDCLEGILAEFQDPKQEIELATILNYQTLALNLLDRVAIDYPTVFIPYESGLPICGVAVCGESVLPRAQWDFQIDTSTNFKIIGRTIDVRKGLIRFMLREI
jgi:hypothetical protein